MTLSVDGAGFMLLIHGDTVLSHQFTSGAEAMAAFDRAGVPVELWGPTDDPGEASLNVSALESGILLEAVKHMFFC